MESSNRESKENNKENESAKLNPIIDNLKSDYFLQKLYDNIRKKKKLEIVKYNKRIHNRLNLCTKEYKEYSETYSSIEIEIIPSEKEYGKFININKKENEKYFHIYLNNKEEIKRQFLYEEDKVKTIKIIIDYQIISFAELFKECKCIEYINFKKINRANINDMSEMFCECSSLKSIDFFY